MRRTRVVSALVAAAAILLLSGCVRFQAQLTVTPQNTLNGDIVVASIVGDGDSAKDDAKARAESIENQLLPNLSGAVGVTRTDYDEDGYAGSRLTLSNTPIEAIGSDSADGSLSLTRDGDTFVFDGVINFTPDSDEEPDGADDSNIEVAITFPGAVSEHNGALDGTRVSWNTSYEGSLEMHAVAGTEPVGPSPWLLALAVLAIIAVIAIVVVVSRKRPRPVDAP